MVKPHTKTLHRFFFLKDEVDPIDMENVPIPQNEIKMKVTKQYTYYDPIYVFLKHVDICKH